MKRTSIILLTAVCLLSALSLTCGAQVLPTDGPLTVRPVLQKMGERLLRGRTGSIVAIQPETGEILCLATNSPQGPQLELAIELARKKVTESNLPQICVLLPYFILLDKQVGGNKISSVYAAVAY